MRIFLTLILLAFVAACSHPLEITGEGDIVSASGDRTCLLSNFTAGDEVCSKNYAVGDYLETYYAVAHAGWQFDHWANYCTDAVPPNYDCSFNVAAATVGAFFGVTVPPLVAVFTPVSAIAESDTVTALGRQWAQPDLFVELTWNEMNTACPAGACPDGATLNGYDVAGWKWATVNDTNTLFNAYFGSTVMGPGPDEFMGLVVPQFFAVTNWRSTEDAPLSPALHFLTADSVPAAGNAYSASVFVDSEDASRGTMRTDVQVSEASGSAAVGALLYRDTDQIARNTVIVGDKEWAQPDVFVGASWNDIIAACPGGLCGSGAVINGFDLNGWIFASVDEVNALFNSLVGAAVLGPGQDVYFEGGSDWAKAFFVAGFRETGRHLNIFRFVQGATRTDSPVSLSRASHGAIVDRISATLSDEARTDYSGLKSDTQYAAWFYRPAP